MVFPFQHYSIHKGAENHYGDLGTSGQVFDSFNDFHEPHWTSQVGCLEMLTMEELPSSVTCWGLITIQLIHSQSSLFKCHLNQTNPAQQNVNHSLHKLLLLCRQLFVLITCLLSLSFPFLFFLSLSLFFFTLSFFICYSAPLNYESFKRKVIVSSVIVLYYKHLINICWAEENWRLWESFWR